MGFWIANRWFRETIRVVGGYQFPCAGVYVLLCKTGKYTYRIVDVRTAKGKSRTQGGRLGPHTEGWLDWHGNCKELYVAFFGMIGSTDIQRHGVMGEIKKAMKKSRDVRDLSDPKVWDKKKKT